MGIVELAVMLCIVEDLNTHGGVAEPGEVECFGIFGWRTGNREGPELVELVARNGLAIAGLFVQQQDSHRITYRSGQHRTEL